MVFTRNARRLGIASALGFVCLSVVYDVTLGVGLASLPSPAQQIGDPYFSALEVLIILMIPLLVTLMVAVHAWAPSHRMGSRVDGRERRARIRRLERVIVGDMRLRNIGIIGYAGTFPIATFLLTLLFWKTEPVEA